MDLLSRFTETQLIDLERSFHQRGALTQDEFIAAALQALRIPLTAPDITVKAASTEDVAFLQKLYTHADVDGLNWISWSTFIAAFGPEEVNTRIAVDDPESQTTSKAIETPVMALVQDDKLTPVNPPGLLKVSRVRAFESVHLIVTMFTESDTIAFYRMGPSPHQSLDDRLIGTITVPGEYPRAVLDVAYHEDGMLLFASVGGFAVQAFDLLGMVQRQQRAFDRESAKLWSDDEPSKGPTRSMVYQCKHLREMHSPVAQQILLCVQGTTKMLGCTHGGDILVWYVHVTRSDWTEVDVTMYPRGTLQVHVSPISDALCLHDLGLVLTCCLGGTLACWAIQGLPDGLGGTRGVHDEQFDMALFATPGLLVDGIFLRNKLTDDFPFGCRSMCYLKASRILLVSGFSPSIHVFDMHSTYPRHMYTLSGYIDNIIALMPLEHPQATETLPLELSNAPNPFAGSALSVDEKGMIRWWNFSRDYPGSIHDRCMQDVRVKSGVAGLSVTGLLAAVPLVYRTGRPTLHDPSKKIAEELFHSTSTSGGVSDSSAESAERLLSLAASLDKTISVLLVGNSWHSVVFEPLLTRTIAGTLIAYCNNSETVCLLNTANAAVFDWFSGDVQVHQPRIRWPDISTAFPAVSKDGKRVFIGHVDGSVRVVHAYSGRTIRQLFCHGSDVTGVICVSQSRMFVSISITGDVVCTADTPSTIAPYEGNEAEKLQIFRIRHAHGKGAQLTAIAKLTTAPFIATGDGQGGIRTWRSDSMVLASEQRLHDLEVMCILPVPNSSCCMSIDVHGNAVLWCLDRTDKIVVVGRHLFRAGIIAGSSKRAQEMGIGVEGAAVCANGKHNAACAVLHRTGDISFWNITIPEELLVADDKTSPHKPFYNVLSEIDMADTPIATTEPKSASKEVMAKLHVAYVATRYLLKHNELAVHSVTVCGREGSLFGVCKAGELVLYKHDGEEVNRATISPIARRSVLAQARVPWHEQTDENKLIEQARVHGAVEMLEKLHAGPRTPAHRASMEVVPLPPSASPRVKPAEIGVSNSEGGERSRKVLAALQWASPRGKSRDVLVPSVPLNEMQFASPRWMSREGSLAGTAAPLPEIKDSPRRSPKSDRVTKQGNAPGRLQAHKKIIQELVAMTSKRHAKSMSLSEIGSTSKTVHDAVEGDVSAKHALLDSPGLRALTFAVIEDGHKKLSNSQQNSTPSSASNTRLPSASPKGRLNPASPTPAAPRHKPSTLEPRSKSFTLEPRYKPMTLEEHFELSVKGRVGGQYKRDVDMIGKLLGKVDPGKRGLIYFEDLKRHLSNLSSFVYLGKQIEMLFRSADKHSRGMLHLDQFVRVLFPKASPAQALELTRYYLYQGPTPDELRRTMIRGDVHVMDLLHTMFDTFDKDKSGTIDAHELEAVFTTLTSTAVVDDSKQAELGRLVREMMRDIGAADGTEISFDEFVDAIGPYVELEK